MDLSGKHKVCLQQFQTLIADVREPTHDEQDLLKWLHARAFDPKKAEAMYRKSMKWRMELDVDNLPSTYEEPEVMKKLYAGGRIGTDKDGCIIRLDPSGRNDVKGIQRSVRHKDIIKTNVARVERCVQDMREWSKMNGQRADQVVQIMDMEGFTASASDMSSMHFYLDIMRVLDDHYPGLMKKSYIINAPGIFNLAWKIMKRFLSKEITDKFTLIEGDYKEILRSELPVDQIPEYYGGTLRDENDDPMCKSKICYGGKIPESSYLTVESCLPANESKSVQVGRADYLLVDVTVEEVPSLIKWTFASVGSAIQFGIYYENVPGRQGLDEMEIIEPVKEIPSHVVPEEGSTVCERKGNYFLLFDNRSSRLSRRKVIYRTEVVNM